MEKIGLEVTCKGHRFGYWNSCKRLPNFVNVAALAGRRAGGERKKVQVLVGGQKNIGASALYWKHRVHIHFESRNRREI